MANGVIGKVTAGGGTHLVTSTFYGTCATAAATAAKIVKLADSTADAATLLTGMTLAVKFTNSNTVANPTLTVQRNSNTTNLIAAKSIMRYGTTAPGTTAATSWRAGAVVIFVYDGTNWVMVSTIDDNSTYIVPTAGTTATAVSTTASGGSATTWSKSDHVHSIALATGDNNGQVKIAGTNVSVKGLGSAAYTASTAYATSSHNHDSTYVNVSGDTMTGALTLSGAPTANLHAATKQYVDQSFAANDAMIFKGTIGSSGATVTALPNTHSIGWTYRVLTAGTYAGVACEIGDLIICIADGTAANNAHWTVAQTNLDGAVIGPASATDGNIALFDGTTGKLIKNSSYSPSSFASAGHNHDSVYVNVSGDTMTGGLNTANNVWNKIGDDAQLGDINKAGHIGIQGLNGNTGIFFTTYNQTTKTTGGAITWDGSKFTITGTISTNISGNANTATTATKLGTATVGSANRGIYLNAGTPTALTWYPNSVAVNSGNTNNYPWHRVATVNLGTGSWVDKDAILFIRSRYNGGKYGIIKISARANNATTNPKQSVDISAGWIVRYGFAVGDIRIAKQGLSGESAQVDVYVKCVSYMRAIAYFEEGSNNGWSLIASTEVSDTTTSDKKTSVEVWADITTSQGAITYDTIKDATDIGTVSYANSAGILQTARTINGTNFNGSENITTANWGTARTLTIGSSGKSVNGSANVSWTLAEIGAAAANHTHNYAGSSSVGGPATSANYVNLYEARATTTTLNKTANYVGAGTMFHLVASSSTSATDNGKPPMGDANVLQMNWDNAGGYDAQLAISTGANRMEFRDRASQKNAWREVVTSTPGTAAGGATTPVYISTAGVATAVTLTGATSLRNSLGLGTGNGALAVANGGTGATSAADARTNLGITPANIGAATSSHTHTTSLASGGTATINLAANTAYTLTAGGTSVIFKTPADNNTTYPVAGKTIDGNYKTAYRTQTKGDTAQGWYISAIRENTASIDSAPQFGSGLAWGNADTHGYLYASYSGDAVYVGAGNADKLNWVSRVYTTNYKPTAADVGAAASSHNHDTAYVKKTGDTMSGSLTVGTTSQSAAPTGSITVHDTRNYTWTPTSLEKGVNWYFTMSNSPVTSAWWSVMHINGWTGDYNAWELAGPSHNSDQRTTPLYVRSGRTTNGWGSWRKIYDTSNKPSVTAHSYTPAGTNSAPAFTGTAATIVVNGGTGTATYTPAGTIAVNTAGSTVAADDITAWTTNTPTAVTKKTVITTASVSNEVLTLTSGDSVTVTAGTAASLSYTARTVKSGDASYKFTGTGTRLTASYTPAGSVAAPTFTGTAATLSHTVS